MFVALFVIILAAGQALVFLGRWTRRQKNQGPQWGPFTADPTITNWVWTSYGWKQARTIVVVE